VGAVEFLVARCHPTWDHDVSHGHFGSQSPHRLGPLPTVEVAEKYAEVYTYIGQRLTGWVGSLDWTV